jgi:hypothetical protein
MRLIEMLRHCSGRFSAVFSSGGKTLLLPFQYRIDLAATDYNAFTTQQRMGLLVAIARLPHRQHRIVSLGAVAASSTDFHGSFDPTKLCPQSFSFDVEL